MNKGRPEHPLKGLVYQTWLQLRESNRPHTALAVHQDIKKRSRSELISYNTVNKFVKEAREEEAISGMPNEPWTPWSDDISAEDHDFLLQMNTESVAWLGRPLFRSEALWGRRIRVSVTGLTPFTQFALLRHYAFLDSYRVLLGLDAMPTKFLDALLAIKPWVSTERQKLWFAASQNESLFKGSLELFWIPPLDDYELLCEVFIELKCESDERDSYLKLWPDLTMSHLGGWDSTKPVVASDEIEISGPVPRYMIKEYADG